MTLPTDGDPGARRVPVGRLRDIEAVTDAALSRLDEQSLLRALLERVKKVLQADTAAVLLLDRSAGQLVATAASGIEEEVRQGVRIPLGAGFAGRVAASREPVILTTVDHTTVRNPLLVDRGIKSLLGVPLLVGGNVIGVIHVGSLSQRRFGREDAELLQLAADRAALALHSIMSQDDALAAMALHRSLLPTALPAMPGLDLAARYVTGTGTVGGDWYDVFILPDGRLGVVVGDVAGSGLEAAVIMGRMRSALRAYVLEFSDPGTALRMLDRKIQYFEPDAMATVLYGVYTPGTGEFAVSSAGHLPPVLAAPGRRAGLIAIQPDPPIGTADDPQRQTATVSIPPGALVCCFTDGLVERRDHPIDHGFGKVAAILDEQIAAGIRRNAATESLAEDACVAVMRTLVGNVPAQDDIAVLILSRRPLPAAPAGPSVAAPLCLDTQGERKVTKGASRALVSPDDWKRRVMADTAEFTIGAEVSCSDGAVGKVNRVVVDPVARALTHLVVEPGFRHGPSRLVPLSLVVSGSGGGEIRLGCTRAEFEKLEPAEETKFVPRTTSFGSFGAGDVLSWPYYGAGGVGDLDGVGGAGGMGAEDGSPISRKITYDTVPVGEVGVRRGQPVLATDGAIGHVQGLVIRPGTGHVTHVLLREGHLWGRKEVAIPISAVDTSVDGTQLTIAKQDVENLPPVDVDHPEN